jgi:hypothetical protein
MLGSAKLRLAGIAENFRNLASLTSFNSIVEILECPPELLAHGPAHAGFAGAHESNQDDGLRVGTARACGPASERTHHASRPLRTPFAPIRFALRFGYCFSERFLRWILPLNVRKTTVEDTATRPMVPAKARPLSIGK